MAGLQQLNWKPPLTRLANRGQKMKTIIISILMVLGSLSFAAGRPYGESGCGLGSIIMGKDGSQVLSATSNATSYSQLFGISSGTSNCIEDGAVKAGSAVPMFIEVNKSALAKDAARGEGETLVTLAQLMGCNSKSLGAALKSNYKKIFVESDMDPRQIETGINSAVSLNRGQACGA